MIKVYVMETCPDCTHVKEQAKGDNRFTLIDIGAHVRNLKEFLRLRDTHPAFADIRADGKVGIPCFVTEEGNVTFDWEEVALTPVNQGASCSLDGKGC